MRYNTKTISSRFFLLVVLICLLGGAVPVMAGINEIDARQAQALIEKHNGDMGFVILDIRTPAEYRQGHIAGALSIDYYSPQFKSELDRLDRTKTYLVYCRSGNRSGKALELFNEMGFTSIYHMSKGIIDWQARGLKLMPAS